MVALNRNCLCSQGEALACYCRWKECTYKCVYLQNTYKTVYLQQNTKYLQSVHTKLLTNFCKIGKEKLPFLVGPSGQFPWQTSPDLTLIIKVGNTDDSFAFKRHVPPAWELSWGSRFATNVTKRLLLLFPITFHRWTKSVEHPMYRGHRGPVLVLWRIDECSNIFAHWSNAIAKRAIVCLINLSLLSTGSDFLNPSTRKLYNSE